MNTAAQFEILRHEIENVIESTKRIRIEIEIRTKMKDAVKKHNKIIQNIERMNVIFSTSSLIEIVLYSVIICIWIFHFMVIMFKSIIFIVRF